MLDKIFKKTDSDSNEEFSDRKRRIYDFLHETRIGVLSTVDPSGNPHGVVVYFMLDKEFNIAFLTKSGTRKYDNLKRNDHTMLTVFDANSQTTAQIVGRAREITDSYEINKVAGAILSTSLKKSDAGLPPISKLEVGQYTAFTIVPDQIRMAVFSRPDPGDYNELFESIESFELRDE